MWKTSVVPDSWSLGVKKCREFNPDWLYCHWTDEELASFIDSEYPDFRSTYDAYPYDIQRSDAVRYLLLYHYGGLYLDLDIDIVCRLSFNAVISEFRDKSPSLTGSGVILPEGEPFVGVMSEFIAVHKRFDQVMSHVMSGLSVSTKP
jgi:mannosyltransferase OCH1-like enzyme